MFTITFLVRCITPRYDYSTDALLGYRSQIVESFGTYDEAMDYVAQQDQDWEIQYVVSMDVTWDGPDGITYRHEYSMSDLHVNYMPVVTDGIPF